MKNNYNNKKFWLIIHPYVYISIKNKQFFMLNTLNRQYIKSADLELFSIIKRIKLKSNGYVIELSNKVLSDNIRKFINEIKNKYLGDTIDLSYSKGKPIQFYPKLNLEKIKEEMTFRIKASRLLKGDKVKGLIKNISIYINSLCYQNCSFCSSAYLQFENCYKLENKNNLSFFNIIKIVEDFYGSSLEKIKILGANILLHSEFKMIEEYLNKIPIIKEYYLNYLNVVNYSDKVKILLNKTNLLKITVHFPINKTIFKKIFAYFRKEMNFILIRFVIESENQYKEAEQLSQEFQLKNTEIIPYHNQNNTKFFEDNIFLTEESILEKKISLNQIFTNQIINQKNFKNITVTCDKMAYANINHSSLGKVDKDNLMDIIVKEINKGKSWYHTRNKVKPCKNCLFQDVCPPISNYEYYIGKYNVCQVQK